MRKLLVNGLALLLALVYTSVPAPTVSVIWTSPCAGVAGAAVSLGDEGEVRMIDDSPRVLEGVGSQIFSFGVAQAGTTWLGAVPPYGRADIAPSGVWDFDNGGTISCIEDGYSEYIKNGTFAQYWTSEDIHGTGDYTAIRSSTSFLNNSPCGFDGCGLSGCVLAFYDPATLGEYGPGGHFAGQYWNRAWSPTIDLTSYPPRGYVLRYDRYADLPVENWIFYRHHVTYVQDVACPLGTWSEPASDNYAFYAPRPQCAERMWDFTGYVPRDADSVKVGLSVWNGANIWGVTPTTGNESPIFDNVRLGIYDLSAPRAAIRDIDNYTDVFPEEEDLLATHTALIDVAHNLCQTGDFLRLGDTLVVTLEGPEVTVELCFRIRPGPGTNLANPFFTVKYPAAGGWTACELVNDYFCTRMDTAFYAGDGQIGSPYEFQVVEEGRYASLIHEEDPLYVGEGEEIFPDSLFTPGTQIYYAVRTSNLPGPGPYAWLPAGADMNDVSTLFEVEVLPNLCTDPPACLLYVDYFNRGAQGPIENALTLLGRTWDRFDLRGESSHQGNGIGNRWTGVGKYRLQRGPIGPTLAHLGQYKVMLINNGDFGTGVSFSDGGTSMIDDPSHDIVFLDNWINEGTSKGLWLSGDNIACDFANATGAPKPSFLSQELATDLVSCSYREAEGHAVSQSCRMLRSSGGSVVNNFSLVDSFRVTEMGCPEPYDFDAIEDWDPSPGIDHVALRYDESDYYASVTHTFRSPSFPDDTVRTVTDCFSLHNLRMNDPPCDEADNIMIALWMRDVLGGVCNDGFFYDNSLYQQYCPPAGPEDPMVAGCTVSPTSLDFGNVSLGSQSDLTFTVKNTGFLTLTGEVGESSAHYSIVSGGGAYSLDPAESLTVTVRFEPTSSGAHNCAVSTGCGACPYVSCTGFGMPNMQGKWALHYAGPHDAKANTCSFSVSQCEDVIVNGPGTPGRYDVYVIAVDVDAIASTRYGISCDGSFAFYGWTKCSDLEQSPWNWPGCNLGISQSWAVEQAGPHVTLGILDVYSYGTSSLSTIPDPRVGYGEWCDGTTPDPICYQTTNPLAFSTVGFGTPGAIDCGTADIPKDPGRKYTNAFLAIYPNPVRAITGTTVLYSAAEPARAEIKIYDAAGRLVSSIAHQAELGENRVSWDGKDDDGRSVPSGVYFCQLKIGEFTSQKKIMLVN